MKKKLLSLTLVLVSVLACIVCLSACGSKKSGISYKISLKLPECVHVEYNNGMILVKDGNEYYVKAATIYSSDRLEVYAKVDLSNPVILDQPQYSQGFITARWVDVDNVWQCAEMDTNYSPWHANMNNCDVYTKGESFLRTGYTDINMPYEMDGVTIAQKDNEVLTISGEQVECIVWEYIYDKDNIYQKAKYWFAKDTNICLKHSDIFDRTGDINDESRIKLQATYYKVGNNMDTALEIVSQHIGETRTKYKFDPKYA